MPGVRGPGPDADHAARRGRALEAVELEVVVEQVADRHREHADELVDLALREAGHPARLAQQRGEVARGLGAERGRLAQHHRLHEPRRAVHQLLELRVGLGVGFGVARDRLGGVLDLVEEEDRPLLGQRDVGGVERDRAVAEAARARGRRRSSAAASRPRTSSARRGRRATAPRSRRRRRGCRGARGRSPAGRRAPGRRWSSGRCGRRRRRSRRSSADLVPARRRWSKGRRAGWSGVAASMRAAYQCSAVDYKVKARGRASGAWLTPRAAGDRVEGDALRRCRPTRVELEQREPRVEQQRRRRAASPAAASAPADRGRRSSSAGAAQRASAPCDPLGARRQRDDRDVVERLGPDPAEADHQRRDDARRRAPRRAARRRAAPSARPALGPGSRAGEPGKRAYAAARAPARRRARARSAPTSLLCRIAGPRQLQRRPASRAARRAPAQPSASSATPPSGTAIPAPASSPSPRPRRASRRSALGAARAPAAAAISRSRAGSRGRAARAPRRRPAPCAGRRPPARRGRRARGRPPRRAGRGGSRRPAPRPRTRRARRRAPRGPPPTRRRARARGPRVVVAEQQLVDRRVVADRRRDPAQPVGLAPDHRRVVERVADVAASGSSSAQRSRGRRRRARAARRRSRSASSAAMPESPPEQVRTASPPSPRGRARGSASTRASSSSSCGSAAQAPPASSTSARKTRWSPASAPVCAAAARAPGLRGADLEHRDADPALGAARQRLGERRAVAVGLEEHRDRADPVALASAASQSLASSTAWLPVEISGVEADPAARAERVDGDVAALRDHRHPARVAAARPSRPTSAPATRPRRSRCRSGRRPAGRPRAPPRAARRSSPRPVLDLAEAGREHDRAAAAARGRRRRSPPGPPAAGIATTTASTGSGRSATRRHARAAVDLGRARGLTPQTGPSNPARSRLRSTMSRVGAGPVVGPDHGDRARREQRSRDRASGDGRRAPS